jgi:glycosyltransferase involved in cell wall biosynthesis
MDFSIITPSFRNSAWLKLCIASVADQQGATHEHIVQDAGSDDGTLDWLPGDSRVRAFVEKDGGMYDAVNRGLRRAQGDLLAYLNCDEQYLPGALAAVKEFFAAHPEVELVFGDTVVVDGDGQFIAYRKVVLPSLPHVWVSHLPVTTCSSFFRRSLIERLGVFFDVKWRDVGDAVWILELLKRNVSMAVLGCYTSAFTQTGQNMNFLPNAIREKQQLRASAPSWMRALHRVWVARHRLRKWRAGCYRQTPFEYAIYTLNRPEQRTVFKVSRPTWRLRTACGPGR